jgi:hypothetical protein
LFGVVCHWFAIAVGIDDFRFAGLTDHGWLSPEFGFCLFDYIL